MAAQPFVVNVKGENIESGRQRDYGDGHAII